MSRVSRSKRHQRKKDFKRSVFVIMLAIVIIAVSTSVFLASNPVLLFYSTGGSVILESAEEDEKDPDLNPFEAFNRQKINLALLGFDDPLLNRQSQNAPRPDTIMIISIDFSTSQVSLVSIPRDSYARIPAYDLYDKINHSYMYGYERCSAEEDPHEKGLKTTLEAIQEFLGGVPIHNYIATDIDGAAKVVDHIGGIYYEVENDIYSHVGEGRLLLEEGYQHLDGNKFMHYVRDRSGGGDGTRVVNQQDIMIELLKQLKSEGGLTDIPEIYRVVNQHIDTDLSFSQVTALALFGFNVDPSEIQTHIFDGDGGMSAQNGQNIWFLDIDEETRISLIKEVFGVNVEKRELPPLPDPATTGLQKPEDELEPEMDEIDDEETTDQYPAEEKDRQEDATTGENGES